MKNIPLKRLFCAFTIFISFIVLSSFNDSSRKQDDNPKKQEYRIKTIVIDPGHGGRATGAAGSFSLEKNVALAVALKLGKMLEENMPDIKLIFTRKTDMDVPLYQRAEIANTNKADLFISIHCNSMPDDRVVVRYTKGKHGRRIPVYGNVPNRSTHGVETLIAGPKHADNEEAALRENADMLLEKNYKENYDGFDPNDPESYIIFSLIKNKFREKSSTLAQLIQDNYIANGRQNRGVKEQRVFILQRAGMPSLLTEIGFISNPEEERYINSDSGQQEVVTAIFNAIKTYRKQLENIK